MRYGSFSVETSYQPSGLPRLGGDAARVGDQSVDQRDVRAVQLALADERDLHVLRHEDLRRRGRRPPRRRPWRSRRCPAEGTDSVVAPSSDAFVTAAARPRALNELVGLSDSSLTNSRESPRSAPEPRRVNERRPALAERDRLLAVEERHQLAIPPHVRLARGERLLLPRPRRVEIVAGEQGHAAACRDAVRRADRRRQRRTARCIPDG